MTIRRVLALAVLTGVTLGGFMLARPGWDSLQRVTRYQRFFEAAVQVAGVAVVVLGLLQVVYGRRKEALQDVENARKMESLRVDAEKRIGEAQAALDAKYAPRSLSDEGRMRLVAQLSRHSGLHVIIARPLGDGEAKAYSLELKRALLQAGWLVDDEHDAVYSGGTTVGLGVRISTTLAVPVPGGATGQYTIPRDRLPAAARALLEAFTEASLEIALQGDEQQPPNQVILLVGGKP